MIYRMRQQHAMDKSMHPGPIQISSSIKCGICGGKFVNHSALLDHIEDCGLIRCKLSPELLCDYGRLKANVFQHHRTLTHLRKRCLQISYDSDGVEISMHYPKHCPMKEGFACGVCPHSIEICDQNNFLH